jgi:hypothetical protein
LPIRILQFVPMLKVSFKLVSVRPLLEPQASDASHNRILEIADVALISVRWSNRYT